MNTPASLVKTCPRCSKTDSETLFYKKQKHCKNCHKLINNKRQPIRDTLKRLETKLGNIPRTPKKFGGKKFLNTGGPPPRFLLAIGHERMAQLKSFSESFGVPYADICRIGIGYYLDYLQGEAGRLKTIYEEGMQECTVTNTTPTADENKDSSNP